MAAGRGGPLLSIVLWAGVAVSVGAVVMRLAPSNSVTPLAQAVSFTPWFGAGALVLFAVSLLSRRALMSLTLLVALIFHGAWLAPNFFPGGSPAGVLESVVDATTKQGTQLRVMTVNAQYGEADAPQITDLVRAKAIDVLAVQELTPALVTRLHAAGLDDLLPHNFQAQVLEGEPDGTGIWSRTKLTKKVAGPDEGFAIPEAQIAVGDSKMRIMAVHTRPPFPKRVGSWVDDLAGIKERAAGFTGPQILMGDFNATYDHSEFRNMLGAKLVTGARESGAGWMPTWPSKGLAPRIQIDHIVVDRSVGISEVHSVTIKGSDHRAVLGTITLKTP